MSTNSDVRTNKRRLAEIEQEESEEEISELRLSYPAKRQRIGAHVVETSRLYLSTAKLAPIKPTLSFQTSKLISCAQPFRQRALGQEPKSTQRLTGNWTQAKLSSSLRQEFKFEYSPKLSINFGVFKVHK